MRLRYFALGTLICFVLSLQLIVTGCAGAASATNSPAPSPTPTPGGPSPSPTPPGPSPTPTPTPGPSPTPTPSSPAAASRFVYGIIDFEADGGFFGGMINSSTGQVSPAPGGPYANTLGQNVVIQVLADPRGRFFYSLNLGASSFGNQLGQPGIGEYQINRSNGSLSPVPNGEVIFSSGQRNAQMAIDGNGKFLYQPDGNSTDVYSINQSSGLLTLVAGSNTAVPVGAFSTASPDGRFFLNAGNGSVEAFSINQGNGQLISAGTPVSTGGSSGPILVSSDSTLVFAANTTQGTLAVFRIGANGALTPVSGSPFTIQAQAEAMSLSPDSKFLYITFGTPSQANVQGYAVNLAAGNITAIPAAAINNADSINVDGSGKFAYVSQAQLVTYTIDPTTGALTATSQTSEPLTDNATDIVLTP